MANAVVLTSHQDRRSRQPNFSPVWEYVYTFTFEADGGVTEQTVEVPVNGILQEATIEAGTIGGESGTVAVDFDDSRDAEFSANAGLIEGSDTFLSFSKPVATFNIRVTPTVDPANGQADHDVVVTVRGI